MSFGIQTQSITPITEISLFAAEAEETFTQEAFDSSLPDAPGGLKTPGKTHSLTPKADAPYAKETREYVRFFGPKTKTDSPETNKQTFMEALATTYRPTVHVSKGEGRSTHPTAKQSPNEKTETPTLSSQQTNSGVKGERLPLSTTRPQNQTKSSAEQATHGVKAKTLQETTERRPASAAYSSTRQWTKEETKKWWETRYHQRERQGDQKKDDQHHSHEEEEKKFSISKSANVSAKHRETTTAQKEIGGKVRKPELTPPKLGVFALYYLLTKMGIASDGTSNFAYKKEIEFVDGQTNEIHKKRLEEIKEAIKKEKETERWGIAYKVFSWIASLIAMIVGIALIATGVGAVAGAMLIAGGTIQMTNQIMEITGGWKKIVELLPGEDTEKKRAVISWMQIGIAVLCLVLCAAGGIWHGFSNLGPAMQLAVGVLGAIAAMGHGVTTIGEGIEGFMFKERLADVKKFDIKLASLKHMRQDLMDKVQGGIDRLEKLFEDLAQTLAFEEELFQADQMVNRR